MMAIYGQLLDPALQLRIWIYFAQNRLAGRYLRSWAMQQFRNCWNMKSKFIIFDERKNCKAGLIDLSGHINYHQKSSLETQFQVMKKKEVIIWTMRCHPLAGGVATKACGRWVHTPCNQYRRLVEEKKFFYDVMLVFDDRARRLEPIRVQWDIVLKVWRAELMG